MNLLKVKELQTRMPYKKIFYDTIYKCYRLICPTRLYEYIDEEGREHKRRNVETLVSIWYGTNYEWYEQ